MDNPYIIPLSLLVFLPTLGALLLAFFPGDRPGLVKGFSLSVTVAVLVGAIVLMLPQPTG